MPLEYTILVFFDMWYPSPAKLADGWLIKEQLICVGFVEDVVLPVVCQPGVAFHGKFVQTGTGEPDVAVAKTAGLLAYVEMCGKEFIENIRKASGRRLNDIDSQTTLTAGKLLYTPSDNSGAYIITA